MPRRPARDLSVGVVVALALLILAVAIMSVGEDSQLFANRTLYKVIFPNADGLRIGSPVRMAGVTVGSVVEIELPTDPQAEGIAVQFGVNTIYAERLRENSEAALRYLQLLSREKFVELTPGDAASPKLPAGATIPNRAQTELFEQLEQGGDIAENIEDITVSLKGILGPLERGEGLLGKMIHDPEFATEGVEALNKALADLHAITSAIREGKGFAGRLLFDEEFGKSVDQLASAMRTFNATMDAVDRREGALGAMLEEGGSGEQAIEEIRDAAASLRRTAMKLEAKDGLLGKFADPEYSTRVSEDLAATLRNLREITAKINAGEGTVGALINSRTVYEGMEQIVAGVNDSGFARWLMRRYQKKGIEAQEEGGESVTEEPEP